MVISLLTTLELILHADHDRMVHLLRLGVVGVDQPLAVEIESDFYCWPRILCVHTHGGIELPPRLQDLLIFTLFDILATQLDGTDIAELPIPDATSWIESQFLDAEAAILLAELRRHVRPLGDFDAKNATAFTPLRLQPPQNGQSS